MHDKKRIIILSIIVILGLGCLLYLGGLLGQMMENYALWLDSGGLSSEVSMTAVSWNIGNCDIQLMLGCTDDVTAKHFSDRSGDMSIQINSTMTVRQTIAMAQVIPQYRQTEGQGRRKLLTPDEVLRLPNEEMLCIIRGYNILKLRKFDYTKHPISKQIRRTSIVDYNPVRNEYRNQSTEITPAAEIGEKTVEEKSARRKKLYSSAAPPSEF